MKKLGEIILGVFLFSLTPIQVEAKSPIYESEVPNDIQIYAELCSAEYHICPELLEAIAYHESRYQPDVKNGKCVGLMQVNVKVHKDRIKEYGWTEEDMYDPCKNMIIASDLLQELFEEQEDVAIVLMRYNGDLKAERAYKEYGTLTKYVDKILKKSAELEREHNK